MRRRAWTRREVHELVERFLQEGPFLLAREFGRSEDAVTSFARRCGLRKERRAYRLKKARTATDPPPLQDIG